MVDHLTPGIGAAHSRTGVDTLLTDASCRQAALGTDDTFWAAVWRAAGEVGLARADAGTIHLSLLAVGSTGIGIARVFWHNRFCKQTKNMQVSLCYIDFI